MKKRISLLLVLMIVMSLLVGCGEKEAPKTEEPVVVEEKTEESTNGIKEGGTFLVSIGREPGTYNPCATPDDAAYIVNQNIFNKLLKINGNDEVIGDLAKDWNYSEDGKTLVFNLYEDVKWHDGEKFSAADVKWTFDTILEEEGFASNSLRDIEEINVLDDNTIEFKLSEANSGLLGNIAWMGTYIMPKHIYEGTDWLENEANHQPVGTGPFKFVEHREGESVTVERNDSFFGDVPHLDKIVFKIIPDGQTAFQAWKNGETDETRNGVDATELPELEASSDYVITDKTWPNKSYITFNTKEGKFSDVKVREAVLYGIDRQEIFTKALKEMGSISEYFICPNYSWALNEDVKHPDRDLEKAMALLEEAGYEKNADGYYFETTIDTFPGWDDVVTVLASNFEEFGVKLTHNSMDDAAYDEKVLDKQDFEMTVLGGYQGPDISAMGIRFNSEGPMNYGLYNNKEMDEELQRGNEATSLEDRAVHYRRVQEILREDLPAVFFADKGAKIPTKAYVKGHPANEAREKCSEAEFTYVWLDK